MVSSSRLVLGQLAVWLLAISNVRGDFAQCIQVRQVFQDCECEEAVDDKGQPLLLPVVDCSGRNLTQVPVPSNSYNNQIYEIRLNNNNITSLGSDIFNSLQVRKIDLSGNAISSVSNNTFRALTDHLLILHMDGDSVSPPPKAAFTKLLNVEELVLRKFKVQDLELRNGQGYFLHFPNLKYLTLDDWGIQSIDIGSFQGPTQLWSLSLLNQELRTLPVDELQSTHLKSLRSLTVSHNPLNDITSFIFSGLDNINVIDLSSNSIDNLEADCFANVGDTLSTLRLSHNILQQSNQLTGLRSLSQLQELDLSSNSFNIFPNLSQLNTTKQLKLYLNNNGITTLPANAFSDIANVLTTVDLSHNGITLIDDNVFQGVINLEVLSMVDSAHSAPALSLTLPSSLTQSKNTLKQLNFSGQKFTTSSLWSVVGQLFRLEVLDLAQNQLTSIPDLALQALTSLQSLDLSQNSLQTLTQRSLVGPRNTLKQLYLSNNAIIGLPSCLFYNYTSYPISLTLANNPLDCTCDLKWLWMETRNNRIVFPPSHEAKCFDNQLLTSKTEAELCPTSHTDPTCEEHYTTPPPITSTPRPDPGLSVTFVRVTTTSITVEWSLSKTDGLTDFKVTVFSPYSSSEFSEQITNTAQRQVTATGLSADAEHEVCVTAYFATGNHAECKIIRTADAGDTTPSGLGGSDDSEDVGIIIGAVIGGVVLLAIVAAIVYLVFIRRRPTKDASNNVPSQPRNFSKAELPSMSPETRSFARPRRSAGSAALDHGDGMQVVAISDGQTSNGRVGRAQMLTSDGSYKVMGNNNKSSSSTSGQSYENDRPSLPPIPPSNAPPSYYNEAFEDDKYDKVEPQKVVTAV